IAAEFCGSKKSLATGLPMASVMFGSGAALGLLILPLMIYHQIQLLICSWLAADYGKEDTEPAASIDCQTMDTIHYVRTTLSVPGAGMAIHIAELKELNSQVCEMLRLIALDPNNSIVGAAAGDAREGNIDMPTKQVPHPETYDQFPDIEATYIDSQGF